MLDDLKGDLEGGCSIDYADALDGETCLACDEIVALSGCCYLYSVFGG